MAISFTKILWLDSVESTNTWVADFTEQYPAETHGLVVAAKEQTAGRGQRGNVWQSAPNENLTVSICLQPITLKATELFVLSQWVALSVLAVLKEVLPHAKIQLKWPNDILINHKKIAGILIENQITGSFVSKSIIGIGLNINQTIFPGSLSATSLAIESGRQFDPKDILNLILDQLEIRHDWLLHQRPLLKVQYLRSLLGYQEWLRYETNTGEQFEAEIVDVEISGRIVLQTGLRVRAFQFQELKMLL